MELQKVWELYQRDYEKLYKVAYIITKNPETAEDALHNGFIKAIGGYKGVRDLEKLDKWIFTIVRNEALKLYNKDKRVVASIREEAFRLAESSFEIPDEWLEQNEKKKAVVQALDGMSPILKEVIYLHYYAGLSFKEIARSLGEKEGTIRMRHLRAKGYLYERLIDVKEL